MITRPLALIAVGGLLAFSACGSDEEASEPSIRDGIAEEALLTTDDLPDWTVAPDDGDDSDGPDFESEDCEAIEALRDENNFDEEAEVELDSPDQSTQINHRVTVGAEDDVRDAFDAASGDTMADCLSGVFNTFFNEPGAIPGDFEISEIVFTETDLDAGDEAAGYSAPLEISDPSGESITFDIHFDVVRVGNAISLLMILAQPSDDPVDPQDIAELAADKMDAITS